MDKEQVICSWVKVVSKDLVAERRAASWSTQSLGSGKSVTSLVHVLTVQMCENIVCSTETNFSLFPLADWGWLRG